MLNLFLLYQFIRKLATPFEEWDAYELGIIDENGEILKKRKQLTTIKEKNAFTIMDLMILRLKKILAKSPLGKSKLASYAAALYLIKEWNHFTNETMLNESISDYDAMKSADQFEYILSNLKDDISIISTNESRVNKKMHDLNSFFEERFLNETPTNSAGSGAVAGIGVGPDGEPGFTKAQRLRYFAKNKRKREKYGI